LFNLIKAEKQEIAE